MAEKKSKNQFEKEKALEDNVTTEQFTFFWKGWPCQWFPSQFEEEGRTYNCTEQYMMAEKAKLFGDEEIREKILNSEDPRIIKAFGRKVSNFNQKIWDENKFKIVVRGNFLKFSQNPSLKSKLLATKGTKMVEASPLDAIWGIGLDVKAALSKDPETWPGQNLLGKALDEVRDHLLDIN